MINKIRVGLIYGGNSPEHDVSKMTAQSIIKHIDRDLFTIKEIYIDRDGKFDKSLLNSIDVAFLAVHGPNCEDGKLQKILENHNVKYTGSHIEASQINMDKVLMHKAFKKDGLPVVEFKGFKKSELKNIKAFVKEIGYPVFIKPNNAGSSIGIDKAATDKGLEYSLKRAFLFDNEIIIEKAVIKPREIEIGVLGNNHLTISNPGEVLTDGKFYSYNTKYFNPFKTALKPKIEPKVINNLKDMAKKAYISTGCTGYARIDFFLDEQNNIFINEINTLPGFTSISMFPKLMAEIGINYKELITKIINLALE